jgi:hypothetical protein
MRSSATNVDDYLQSLPPDRKEALVALRKTILANLPRGYEESFDAGMLSYQVPLAVYPDTYNKKPLCYAVLASQKNHMAVYLCNVYGSSPLRKQLEAGFKKAGKKLDMGASCVRFKKLDDLPLEVIARSIAATPMKKYVEIAKAAHSKEAKAARSAKAAKDARKP